MGRTPPHTGGYPIVRYRVLALGVIPGRQGIGSFTGYSFETASTSGFIPIARPNLYSYTVQVYTIDANGASSPPASGRFLG